MSARWKVALVGALLLLLGLVAWAIDHQRQSEQQALEQINLTATAQENE